MKYKMKYTVEHACFLHNISTDNGDNLTKDDFTFDKNHKYCIRKKRNWAIVTYEDSSWDDNTDNEEYSTHSSDESDDDKVKLDSKVYQ